MADPNSDHNSSSDQSYDFADPSPPKPKPASRIELDPAVKPKPPAPPPPVASPASDSTKMQESTCPSCGFTMHGPPKAHCPECAAPMDRSVSDQIKFADPQWVRGVATGLILLTLPIAGHTAAPFLRFLEPSLAAWLHVVSAALLAAAVFMTTRAQPLGKSPGGSTVMLARASVVISLAFWLLLAMRVHPDSGQGLSVGPLKNLDKILAMAALAANALLSVMLGFFCGRLAANIPDDSLASHSINGGWIIAIACTLLMALQMFELTTRYHIMFYFCSFPMIAGILVIVIFVIVTLLRLSLEMRTSAAEGEAIRVRKAERAAGIKPAPKIVRTPIKKQ